MVEQVLDLILNERYAENFFEKNFGSTTEVMLNQGYTQKDLEGAKNIVINSLLNLSKDPKFRATFSKIYRKHFTDEELKDVRDFYATKTGQKLNVVLMDIDFTHGEEAQNTEAKYLSEMHSKLQLYFESIQPKIKPNKENKAN